MIGNVGNAGFNLIIAYRHTRSSACDLSISVQNMLFPIVSISGKYAQYLSDNTLSDSPYDAITSLIKTEVTDLAVSVLISMAILACASMCSLLFLLLFYSRKNELTRI